MPFNDISNTPDPKAKGRYRTPSKAPLPPQARGSVEAELAAIALKTPSSIPEGRRLDYKKNRTGKGEAKDGKGTPSHWFAKSAYADVRDEKERKLQAERLEKLKQRKDLRDQFFLHKDTPGEDVEQQGVAGQPEDVV